MIGAMCSGSPQASMGLETMLFGVSGSWEDMDATSLPVEFEPGPPSEKLTCGTHQAAVRHRPGSESCPNTRSAVLKTAKPSEQVRV